MEELYVYGLTIMVTMLGYFLHQLSADLKFIQKEHNICKQNLPHIYVLKEDYHQEQKEFKADIREDIAEIKSLIGKLFSKMGGKCDG